MKNKRLIVIVVITLTFFFIWEYLGNYILKYRFNKFNNTSIDGRLTQISSDQGFSDIVVNNQEFKFDPNSENDNKATDFLDFAVIGDSIYKPTKADTLKLIHNGKTYLYTFKKF